MIKKVITILLSLVMIGCAQTAADKTSKEYIMTGICKETAHKTTDEETSKAEGVVALINAVTDGDSYGMSILIEYDKENDLMIMQIAAPENMKYYLENGGVDASRAWHSYTDNVDDMAVQTKEIFNDSDLNTSVVILIMTDIDEDPVLYADVDGKKYYETEY